MSTASPSPRRTTSNIWCHFTKVEKRGKCHHCQHLISIPYGSPSNMKRHLRMKHPTVFLELYGPGSRSRSTSMDADIRDITSCELSTLTSVSTSDEVYKSAMQDNTTAPLSSPRRSVSLVWNHFTKTARGGKCHHCNRIISASYGSSSNLKRHLKSNHPTIPLEWCGPGKPPSATSTDAEIQEIFPQESSLLMSTSTSDEVQPRKKKKQDKEYLLIEARGSSQNAKSVTESGSETAEDLFCKFIASELRQMCSEIRQETKANIMAAITEGMRKQSALTFKTVSQTSNQDPTSTFSAATSTNHSFIFTAGASALSITPKEEPDFSYSSDNVVYEAYSDAPEEIL